jgi:gliding motility-associated-like protein
VRHITFPADTGRFPVSLVAVSEFGCKDSLTKLLRIEPDITVFIPSVFYPNSSVNCSFDCNRSFKVAAQGYDAIEIFIFNRWGQMVYKSSNPDEGWNGRTFNSGQECEQDAYIYQINATSKIGKKYSYSGSITLLR